MIIQKIRVSDLQSFSEFSSKVYAENYANHWINNDCSDYLKEQYSVEALRKQMKSGSKYYLATKDSEYLGFMKLNFLVQVLDTQKLATELEKIYFSLNAQGYGYGSLLLDKAIHVSIESGSNTLVLDVLSSNRGARNFYTKHGFKVVDDKVLPHTLFKPELRAMKIMLKEL